MRADTDNGRGGPDPNLPASSYAILGLLTFGEMSGYDLGKLVARSIGFFMTPAKSQIYSELRRLLAHGYASERAVEQDRRPDKRLYRITPKGEGALRAWLEGAPADPDEIRSPFLVKVFFAARMSREALLAQLVERRRRDEERLAELRRIEREIRDRPETFYPYLTLRSGLAHTRASIRWASEAIRELERREGSG